jgi:adenylate cyclase
MSERNADVLEERRIEFRIGVNVGDVMPDRSDIFGDAVNVATRLEGLAEPEGICVSAANYELRGATFRVRECWWPTSNGGGRP